MENKHRSLLLEVTDGQRKLKGLEFGDIKDFNVKWPPGFKAIFISQFLNSFIRNSSNS